MSKQKYRNIKITL